MEIKLFNNRTKQKEVFKPLNEKLVGMYVCGPTVYDFAHLGNARPVVVFDVLFRLLKYTYDKVIYVRNITDVDDKINKVAHETGQNIFEITQKNIQAYHEDMEALNTLKPDIEPKATDHIDQMIDMISNLIKKGNAYYADGHVLFHVPSYSQYGDFSKKNQDELLAGARIETASYKKYAGDFVLWKPSDDKTVGWQSPWGRGRPGWHIECSAMSKTYLGKQFDIHGGGIDLIFPHHENEIAQSCCANNTDFMANFWLHNGHLTVEDGSKMSKSLNNFFTVRDLLKDYDGEVIRLAILQTHYRQPLKWSNHHTLENSKQILDKFYNIFFNNDTDLDNKGLVEKDFLDCLKDDLNTPLAINYMHNLSNLINKEKDENIKKELIDKLLGAGKFLGFFTKKDWFTRLANISLDKIENLIKKRNLARSEKDYILADEIRDELFKNFIVLEDAKNITRWKCLHAVGGLNNLKILKNQLLNKEAIININLQDIYDLTPLHYAFLNKDLDIAKLLLENGSKADIKDLRGKTPLDIARIHGDEFYESAKKIVDLLKPKNKEN